jgi:anion-transporting  ArsA/GET3 family ATPase
MEKVYELETSGGYDLIVLDTPPTAHALDFLDASTRLLDLFNHDAARWLLEGGAVAGRFGLSLMNFGSSYVLKTLSRFTGTELLQSLADFFVAFQGMYEGFRERAAATKALLAGPKTSFVLVTSPAPLTVDEAIFFHQELYRSDIRVAAAVVNRVHDDPMLTPGAVEPPDVALQLARARVPDEGSPRFSDRLAETVADAAAVAKRDRREIERFRDETGRSFPVWLSARLTRDVHDLAGLWHVNEHLVRAPERDEKP